MSQKTGNEKLASTASAIRYGKAHYSWKIVANLYRKGLIDAGINVLDICRPEIYKTDISRRTLTTEDMIYHMAVKPIEELRRMPGAINLFVFGWEFEEISSTDYGVNPYYNQFRILKGADLIICWTAFGANNLRKIGFDNLIVMPPPICVTQYFPSKKSIPKVKCVPLKADFNLHEDGMGYLTENIREGSLIFVTALNPFDDRKCLTSMLTGFVEAVSRGADAYLVVKLIIDNDKTKVWNINEILSNHFQLKCSSDRVFFVGEYLLEENIEVFLSSADFYLCASSAEGLNIPLISSMLLGIPSVSTRCTAMESYLNDDCSIEIKTDRRKFSAIHSLSDHLDLTHYPPLNQSVSEAVLRASKCNKVQRTMMGDAARVCANSMFGINNFKLNVKELVGRLI